MTGHPADPGVPEAQWARYLVGLREDFARRGRIGITNRDVAGLLAHLPDQATLTTPTDRDAYLRAADWSWAVVSLAEQDQDPVVVRRADDGTVTGVRVSMTDPTGTLVDVHDDAALPFVVLYTHR